MPRLLVGNRVSDDLIGTWGKSALGWWAQRLLWFVREGDVAVLPETPDEDFLAYVVELLGIDRAAVKFVVPDDLAGDWLLGPGLLTQLREALAGRDIETVFALSPDSSVAELARRLEIESALPGFSFLTQGGAAIADSKAVFRALAAGSGLPLPEGGVCANPEDAHRLITRLLELGPVIVKKEFLAGGSGNQVLTRSGKIQVNGAERTLVLEENGDAVRAYLDENWEWLSEGRRHRVVVERFYPGSRAIFAEFWISDDSIELGGQGEMVAAPVPDHSYIPTPALIPEQEGALMAGGRRLCEVLQAMGYRGVLSADAIIVGDEVLFTEYNGLVTGSTHVYHMGRRLVGENYARDRVLREQVSWKVESFGHARAHLAREGLAYDHATRTGVVLLNAWRAASEAVPYCLVAEDVEAAERLEKRLKS